jgi:integrase
MQSADQKAWKGKGMRNQKEVFTMRWEHFDWSNSCYFVYDSKTPKARRHVPISPRVRQALLGRYSGQKEGRVFPSKRAKCGHLTTVARQFQDASGQPMDNRPPTSDFFFNNTRSACPLALPILLAI